MEFCNEFDGPVSVTPSPPLASAAGYLFYYSAIHPVVVAQSVVLTSILESSGDVQLPRSVSLPDFELWQKAVLIRECPSSFTHRLDFHMGTLCSVLKVWHKMSWEFTAGWKPLLLHSLRRPAVNVL